MAINVSQAFHRTSANPVDDTMTLTKAQMVAINDNLMPSYYLTVCQDDGYIYLYDKSATASPTTGKFTKFEGGGGGSEATVLTGTLTAAGWSNKSQTATVTGLLATDNGVIGALNTATTAQLEAMRDAVLSVSTVANGAVTFSCEETPSIDIPFGVLIGGSGSGGGSTVDMDVIDLRGNERVVGKVIFADGTEKVMYEKSFDVGQLPNAAQKVILHGISNLHTIVDIFGSYKGSGYFGIIPNVCEHGVATDYSIRIFCDTTNITIKTGSDFSNYTGYVTLRYTKSA